MKAAVLESLNNIVVKEVPKPEIDDNSILVKVKSCAICGSDIRIYRHGNNRVKTPAIIGHEIAGEIVKTGKNITKFKVGDRIAIGADVPCGECSFCEAGIGNNCQLNYAIGYQFQGGFAEYLPLNSIVINYGPVHKIPDNLSYDEAALAEPLGCILNGLELAKVEFGDTAVVIGAGPIGCMIIEVLKKMGAGKVIVIELSKDRLEKAREVSGDVYISGQNEDTVARVLEETGGLGADVIITSCPSPQAQIDALNMAKNRARISLFGGLPKDNSMITIDANIIHYKELVLTGAHGAMPIHHRKALNLIASGIINAKQFISHKFPLDDIEEGFRISEDKLGIRVVINP